MSSKDKGNLLAIIDCCDKIQKFFTGLKNADEFNSNEMIFDAVLMNLITIGEAVSRINDELKVENDNVEWQKIKSLRNLIAHNYFGVDAEEIWEIINGDIAELKEDATKIVSRLEN